MSRDCGIPQHYSSATPPYMDILLGVKCTQYLYKTDTEGVGGYL